MTDIGTNLTQEEYQKLATQDDTKHLSEAEAKILINKWYGFEASRIEVHASAVVADFEKVEKNGAQVWRPKRVYSRKAVCNAPGWNYIRFDVCSNQYELVNGELYFYID